MNSRIAIKEYQTVGLESGIEDASPHKLVSMLLDGAVEKLMKAKVAIQQDNIPVKGILISDTIAIIDSLRASLNMAAGGEIAENLAMLYDYMERTLVTANLDSSIDLVEEVSGLLKEVHDGWNEIPVEDRIGDVHG